MSNIEAVQTIENVPMDEPTTALVKANITTQIIAELKSKAEALTIKGIDDKEGYEAVKRQRLDTRPFRIQAVEIAKAGREEHNRLSALWIAAEKRVTREIQDIEDGLSKKEDAYLALVKARDDEALRIEVAKVKARIDQLLAVGWIGNQASVGSMDEAMFLAMLSEQTVEFQKAEADRVELENLRKAEATRVAKEAEARKAEDLRIQEAALKLEQERAAFEKEKADQLAAVEEQKRRVEAEKIRAEKAESERKATIIEKARQDEIAKLKAEKDALDKKEADRLRVIKEAEDAKAKADRAAELAPDKVKLAAYADSLETRTFPSVSSPEATAVLNEVKVKILDSIRLLRSLV